jgi:hypothetical protein
LQSITKSFVSDRYAPALPFRPRTGAGALFPQVPANGPNGEQATQFGQAVPIAGAGLANVQGRRVASLQKKTITGGTAMDMEWIGASDQYGLVLRLQSTNDGTLIFTFSPNNMVRSDSPQGVVRNTVAGNANRKYAPRPAEQFTPLGNNVLLWRDVREESAGLYNDLKVVAVGSAAMPMIHRGARVWAQMDVCLQSLVLLRDTTDVSELPSERLLSNSPYCVVPATAIVGVVQEGANRAFPFTGHVKKAAGAGTGASSGFSSRYFP